MQREKWVTYRESVETIQDMDKLSQALGIDRSGLIRQTMREKIRAETDSLK